MNQEIKDQIIFVLEDDNEVMESALDSDLDDENKQMNRELIKQHNKLIDKIESGKKLTKHDLYLISSANEIHLNDELDLEGHHRQAVKLNKWLEEKE